jgi:hypothetical protein
MESVQARTSRPYEDQPFATLTSVERRYLEGWSVAARASGIDAVEDLGSRAWPGPVAETVIGVFQSGHLLATWLIVGERGGWAVACCADGHVSGTLPSLIDALEFVCPAAMSFNEL